MSKILLKERVLDLFSHALATPSVARTPEARAVFILMFELLKKPLAIRDEPINIQKVDEAMHALHEYINKAKKSENYVETPTVASGPKLSKKTMLAFLAENIDDVDAAPLIAAVRELRQLPLTPAEKTLVDNYASVLGMQYERKENE